MALLMFMYSLLCHAFVLFHLFFDDVLLLKASDQIMNPSF